MLIVKLLLMLTSLQMLLATLGGLICNLNAIGYICTFKNTQFWLFLASPADPVKFLWFKMAGTGFPLIVLNVSCWTRTSRGYFRPKKSVLSKIATFGCSLG